MLLTPLMKKTWAQIAFWREISRQRHELRESSHYLPKDIGISRASLEREANRPFWDCEPLTGKSPQECKGTAAGIGSASCAAL